MRQKKGGAASHIRPDNRGYPVCPSCGATKPIRALLICRSCWEYVPNELRRAAYKARKDSPKDVALGKLAVKVILAGKER